jgi:hypothetical protein
VAASSPETLQGVLDRRYLVSVWFSFEVVLHRRVGASW